MKTTLSRPARPTPKREIKPGHIYIASNPALPENCLKIGLTEKGPRTRVKQLSRMTAIPSDFELLNAFPVQDVLTAERRLHLILEEKRFSTKKEFFTVTRAVAESCAEIIVAFERENTSIYHSVHTHADLAAAHYYPDNGLVFKKLVNVMMAATVNNSAFDMLLGSQTHIVDGFLSINEIQEQSIYHRQTTVRALKRLQASWKQVHVIQMRRVVVPQVFSAFYYRMGHIGWKFTKDMRQKFFNLKVLDSGFTEV
jgi:hypothetical protein